MDIATPSSVVINGVEFTPRQNCPYKNNYLYQADLRNHPDLWPGVFGEVPGLTAQTVEYAIYRNLILTDLWFIVYFVLGIPAAIANTPFAVKQCQEVENGPKTMTLDQWARGHFKTSIVSIAETIQYHLKHPDRSTMILSYKKGLSEKIALSVKAAYESEFLRTLFPDVLYQNPEQESPIWTLQNGFTIKRKNQTRKEPTVYPSGLVEGMAQGFHCERLVFDDFETEDMANSPDVLDAVYSKFEMAQFLNTKSDLDVQRVIGTIYSHQGPIVRIREMKKADGTTPRYFTRVVPGTVGGAFDGKPVLWSQEVLDLEKTKPHYAMQVLCDPTPRQLRKLHSEYLQEIDPQFIPNSLYQFMTVDPAGDNKGGKQGDSWSIMLLGIDPKEDKAGACPLYILQAIITPLGQAEAIEEIARMYIGAGIVQKLGVEKVALSDMELHIRNALAARGRRLSIEEETLVILRPGNREKKDRIQRALEWPLNNNKLFLSRGVPSMYRERIKMEMDKHPYWKDDALDGLAYAYDIIRDLELSAFRQSDEPIPLPRTYHQPTYVG